MTRPTHILQPIPTKVRLPDDEGYYFAEDKQGRKLIAFFPFGFDEVSVWWELMPTELI